MESQSDYPSLLHLLLSDARKLKRDMMRKKTLFAAKEAFFQANLSKVVWVTRTCHDETSLSE